MQKTVINTLELAEKARNMNTPKHVGQLNVAEINTLGQLHNDVFNDMNRIIGAIQRKRIMDNPLTELELFIQDILLK